MILSTPLLQKQCKAGVFLNVPPGIFDENKSLGEFFYPHIAFYVSWKDENRIEKVTKTIQKVNDHLWKGKNQYTISP